MLGTDWPMLAPEQVNHFVDYVTETLPEADARRILDHNAVELFGQGSYATSR